MFGKQLYKCICMLGICGILLTGMGMRVNANENIAEGVGTGYTWVLDADGKLTVRDDGTGTCNLSNEGWVEYKSQIQIADIDVSFSSHLEDMFRDFKNLYRAIIKIDDCQGSADNMFLNCYSLIRLTMDDFNTENITSMKNMLNGFVNGIGYIEVDRFNTANVTNMSGMFRFNVANYVNLSSFDTSKVTDMSRMFMCPDVTSFNLKNFDTSNVTDMSEMFYGCSKLESVDISSFRTGKVANMKGMFTDCGALGSVDLTMFDVSNCSSMYIGEMFVGCDGLREVALPRTLAKVRANELQGCSAVKKVTVPARINTIEEYGLGYLEQTDDEGNTKFEKINGFEIVGCEGSEAQRYANENGFQFCAIEDTDPMTMFNPFADIERESWKFVPAKYVFDRKLMRGKAVDVNGISTFAPDDKLTRAELAQILYSMSHKPYMSYQDFFDDVDVWDWYFNAVNWANANGIANGVAERKFYPKGLITREQVATMLMNYALLKGYELKPAEIRGNFEDVDAISSWAEHSVKLAVSNGIMSGKAREDGTKILDPKGYATRAECAAMIRSFCLNIVK